MQIVFAATEPALADAFEAHSKDLENVDVFRGSIFDVEADAYVSPANSFGFMDGGIDAWFVWRFGAVVQDNVRLAILEHWQGELPVGTAQIVETADDEVPFLIAAPTMRVPMTLGKDSIHPYLAMRAVIMCARNGILKTGSQKGELVSKHVHKIAVPGMGTGVGKMPFDLAAFQMCEAVRLHGKGKHYLPKSWAEAGDAHLALLQKKSKKKI